MGLLKRYATIRYIGAIGNLYANVSASWYRYPNQIQERYQMVKQHKWKRWSVSLRPPYFNMNGNNGNRKKLKRWRKIMNRKIEKMPLRWAVDGVENAYQKIVVSYFRYGGLCVRWYMSMYKTFWLNGRWRYKEKEMSIFLELMGFP